MLVGTRVQRIGRARDGERQLASGIGVTDDGFSVNGGSISGTVQRGSYPGPVHRDLMKRLRHVRVHVAVGLVRHLAGNGRNRRVLHGREVRAARVRVRRNIGAAVDICSIRVRNDGDRVVLHTRTVQIVVKRRTDCIGPRVVGVRTCKIRSRQEGSCRLRGRHHVACQVSGRLRSVNRALRDRTGRKRRVQAATSGVKRCIAFRPGRGKDEHINRRIGDRIETGVTIRDRKAGRVAPDARVLAGLDDEALRTQVGVVQRTNKERRHSGTGHVRVRVERGSRKTVMDVEAVQLLDGVRCLNGDRT